MKSVVPVILIIGLVASAGYAYTNRVAVKDTYLELTREPLPEAKKAEDFKPNPTPVSTTPTTPRASEDALPPSVNLDVPFTSQAPHANWDLPYQEACEEASVIMAHRFYAGEALNPDIADEELKKLVQWEIDTFGYYKDTTAEESAQILRDYFGYKKVEVQKNFTAEDIRKHLAAGRVVILPAAGRMLGNPNFRQPGPLFHMLVIKGYKENGSFITNDPGTRKGHNYIYSEKTLLNSAHDWNDGDVMNGEKIIIVVYPPRSELTE